jgi:hypothetical protein
VTSRRQQIAENEALFRDVNERVVAIPRHQADPNEKLLFYCECGDEKCFVHLRMTRAEYEAVRAHSDRFAVVVEHAVQETERIVARHDGYAVIEKHQDVRDFVEETDPRGNAAS